MGRGEQRIIWGEGELDTAFATSARRRHKFGSCTSRAFYAHRVKRSRHMTCPNRKKLLTRRYPIRLSLADDASQPQPRSPLPKPRGRGFHCAGALASALRAPLGGATNALLANSITTGRTRCIHGVGQGPSVEKSFCISRTDAACATSKDTGIDGLPSALLFLSGSSAFKGTRHRQASSFPVEEWLVGLNHRRADDRRPQGRRTNGWPEVRYGCTPRYSAQKIRKGLHLHEG